MLQVVSGTVRALKPISTYSVQVFLHNSSIVIELYVSTPWVVHRQDDVSFSGEVNAATGKFIAYAYANITHRVHGQCGTSLGGGILFVIAGLFFCWAIFPLFSHIPYGLEEIFFHRKVQQSVCLLYAHVQEKAAVSLNTTRTIVAEINE